MREDAAQVVRPLFKYVRGTAVNLELEAAVEAATGPSIEEWMLAQEPALRSVMTPGRFPAFERLVTTEYDFAAANRPEPAGQAPMTSWTVTRSPTSSPSAFRTSAFTGTM
jgi:hypothetical protein